MADILIKINGWPFTDWNNLLISKDIESVAGSFEFNLVSKDEEWFPLMEGNQVEILHGKTPVLTGFIDFVGPDLDADDRTIIVSGRDNTGDLVDCTYDGNKTEFVGEQGIDVIATELISQYKDSISLISKLDQVPVLSKFKYDPGEKIWDALERAASEAGVIFQPSGAGDLILTKLASVPEPVKLIEGENILRCYANYDNSARYSHYTIIAELPGTDAPTGEELEDDPEAVPGEDELDRKDRREVTNKKTFMKHAFDLNVTRYRPLTIIAESKMTYNAAQMRINWEMAVRSARAFEASVTLFGWSYFDRPWLPNQIITIRSPKNEIYDLKVIIKSVDYSFDEDGTTTTLFLTGPDAYKPEQVRQKDERHSKKSAIKTSVKTYGYIK